MCYRPIMSTLGYVLSPDRTHVLLTHRIGREGDDQFGKYNGLGGRMESAEDVATCMIREIHEEAGLQVTHMALRGTVNWTGFGPNGEDWFAFVFLITAFRGTARDQSDEGPLVWMSRDVLNDLPMWEGDRYFLPLVFDEDPRVFHGYLPYDGERPTDWVVVRL